MFFKTYPDIGPVAKQFCKAKHPQSICSAGSGSTGTAANSSK